MFSRNLHFILFFSTDPAEIVTLPVDQVVWVGQQVTLFCNVTGNPVPNITYTIVGENDTVGYNKTLVINGSSTAYVKTYMCTANNGIQSPVSAKITVTVLGKSSPHSPPSPFLEEESYPPSLLSRSSLSPPPFPVTTKVINDTWHYDDYREHECNTSCQCCFH